ncbi:uncharacterized protein LOC115621495 [Scaptodrosophila lebanonensis]|uniref:Uncharacterized protein LOC115621495 n=1 Tax=Drosophila lebanonensis TaxID=7225 RepID=A0A6J2T7C2_DROLE|nr:uncharacterized protein LOC115621495 [Scaptodrosophila lebanonensis]
MSHSSTPNFRKTRGIPRLSKFTFTHSNNSAAEVTESADSNNSDPKTSYVRLLKIPRAAPCIESYGFNLTRSKWDPYPWVSEVTLGTPAAQCGLKAGDCVLEVNGYDVLGMRILEISKIVKDQQDYVTLLLWNSGCNVDCDKNTICCAPVTTSLKRLTIIVQGVLSIIECPVCINTITPPAMQCQNGHLLCLNCRIRAERCPMCREFYTPKRALIAEQIFVAMADTFELCRTENKLRHKIFGGNISSKDIRKPKSRSPKEASICQIKATNHCLSPVSLVNDSLSSDASEQVVVENKVPTATPNARTEPSGFREKSTFLSNTCNFKQSGMNVETNSLTLDLNNERDKCDSLSVYRPICEAGTAGVLPHDMNATPTGNALVKVSRTPRQSSIEVRSII